MSKSRFLVRARLEHDGKLYLSGATVELPDEAAAPLLAVNVIESVAAAVEPEDKGRKAAK